MLKAEVDILMRCDHPNVVKMYRNAAEGSHTQCPQHSASAMPL